MWSQRGSQDSKSWSRTKVKGATAEVASFPKGFRRLDERVLPSTETNILSDTSTAPQHYPALEMDDLTGYSQGHDLQRLKNEIVVQSDVEIGSFVSATH